MIADREKLKTKMIRNYNDYNEIPNCSICRKNIAIYDIQDNKFEYVKNKNAENFAHKECVLKMMKK